MNLVEKLLKIETGKYTEEQTMHLKSARLSNLTGEDAEIVIKELGQQQYLSLAGIGLDDEGNAIMDKTYEVNALIAAEAMVEPNIRDKKLLEHLGAESPKEAVKILFKGEVNIIASKVSALCGYGEDAASQIEEIKN